jgi:hypothetical protein
MNASTCTSSPITAIDTKTGARISHEGERRGEPLENISAG